MPPVLHFGGLHGKVARNLSRVELVAVVIIVGFAALIWLLSWQCGYRIDSRSPIERMESTDALASDVDDPKAPEVHSGPEGQNHTTPDPVSIPDPLEALLSPNPFELPSSEPVPISSGDIVRVLSLPAPTVRRHSYPMDEDDAGAGDAGQTRDLGFMEPVTVIRPTVDEDDGGVKLEQPLSDTQAGKRPERLPMESPPEVQTKSDIFRGTTAEGIQIERRDILVKKNGTRRHVRVFEVGGGPVAAFGRMGTW